MQAKKILETFRNSVMTIDMLTWEKSNLLDLLGFDKRLSTDLLAFEIMVLNKSCNEHFIPMLKNRNVLQPCSKDMKDLAVLPQKAERVADQTAQTVCSQHSPSTFQKDPSYTHIP